MIDCQDTMDAHLAALRDLEYQQQQLRDSQFNDFDYSGAAGFCGEDHDLAARILEEKRKISELVSSRI